MKLEEFEKEGYTMSDVKLWESKGNKHLNLTGDALPEPYHKVIADLAIKYLGEKGKFLDIGCGLGEIEVLLHAKNPSHDIFIADAYEQCLLATSKKVTPKQMYKLNKKIFNLDEVDQDFDVIVLSHVLEHLLDPVSAIKLIFSHLRAGGYLIVAVPNPVRPQVIFWNLFRKHYVNRGHVYCWDHSHWKNFLEEILQLVVVEYKADSVNIVPSLVKRYLPKISEKIEMGLARIIPWFSFSNIAVINKSF